MSQPEPLSRLSDAELLKLRMKTFEAARKRHAHKRHVGWTSLHEDELRYALAAAMREPTKHGVAHCDGTPCFEPVWCNREHVPTPESPAEERVSV